MTSTEVDAVLSLWRGVEGTQPKHLHLHRDHNNHDDFVFTLDDDKYAVECSYNEASDLICGRLRRWLEVRCIAVEWQWCTFAAPHRVRVTLDAGDAPFELDAPSLLLALIAAVRAVAGTEAVK